MTAVTSTADAGLLLAYRADKQLGLLEQVAAVLPDERDPIRIVHSLAQLLRQRVSGVVQGYEDLNDHDRPARRRRRDWIRRAAACIDCNPGGCCIDVRQPGCPPGT
ncbi:MAG: transposase [Zoogloeaceae bacterium]|nr:transposase [Rhodocyclaceae bacterium]MCP5232080.1 transposase [Zoogloeaceae bacterium]MCP5238450.1 transposase [Zoogloeaceae bacterium]MCP5254636.1 transposase [Zoogloeaceae bacterium]MCW5614904.1 transposase [Rhodocyclaceae bacterium]